MNERRLLKIPESIFHQRESGGGENVKIFIEEAWVAGNNVKQFLKDGGKEFKNHLVDNYLKVKGISIRRTMRCLKRPNETGV